MPMSFLVLPREIRDIIYKHALLSSTGYVTPILDKSSRSTRFYLIAIENERNRNDTADSIKSIRLHKSVLTLSLSRTCQQIYQETKGMFWSNNIFFFETPMAMVRVLKLMGQRPSRLISSISLRQTHRHWKSLPKAFALLASRARHGRFRKLHLDLPREEFALLKRFRKASHTTHYDDMLEILRDASKQCNFQRSFQVHCSPYDEDTPAEDPEIVRDLHLAFGGCMIYNGKLEWDNYEHVGERVG